jgi:hypothetical protein
MSGSVSNAESAQDAAIARLEKNGWTFSNWVADGDAQVAVMVRQGATRHGRQYCEVEPDGEVRS